MTILQVQYFLSILEYGGFSAAAEEMFISQSSLSKQIKSLEAELGLELFSRSNNKVSLTKSGELFLKYAVVFNRSYTEMMMQMSYLRPEAMEKDVYFGTLPLMKEYNISKFLATMQNTMHNIQINITESNQQELLHLLQARKIDLSILRLYHLDKDIYDFIPIQEDAFTLVCSKEYSTKLGKGPLALSQLKEYPFVFMSCESDIYNICINQFAKADFYPNIICTGSRHLYLLDMVEAGLGITVLPGHMVDMKRFPNLVCIPFDNAISTTIGIVRMKNRVLSRQADMVYQYFCQHELSHDFVD